jgi:hypothetical protein
MSCKGTNRTTKLPKRSNSLKKKINLRLTQVVLPIVFSESVSSSSSALLINATFLAMKFVAECEISTRSSYCVINLSVAVVGLGDVVNKYGATNWR